MTPGAHEGSLHDDDDDDGRRVLARLEDVDLEHGDGQLELATHEETHEYETDDNERACYGEVVARGEGRETIEQADKTCR